MTTEELLHALETMRALHIQDDHFFRRAAAKIRAAEELDFSVKRALEHIKAGKSLQFVYGWLEESRRYYAEAGSEVKG